MGRTAILVAALGLALTTTPAFSARLLSCEMADQFKSGTSNVPISLTIQNKGDAMVRLGWKDFEGGTSNFRMLGAGGETTIETFNTHVWMVEDRAGGCICGLIVSYAQERMDIVPGGIFASICQLPT